MTFEANTSTLRTDFNVTPYYDDFDKTKNFHRILFRPGYAVQARELTQVQSMLQHQIDSFGKHVFREGSIVLPGAFTLECATTGNPIWYVKVKDTDSSNNEVNLSLFQNKIITGNTSGITAYVEIIEDGVETTSDTKTLMINYTNVSNANSQVKTFQAGETLYAEDVGTLVVLNTDPTGKGSIFSIEDGVFFAKEHFISFSGQKTILSKYSDTPTCKVGFLVGEDIIRSSDDTSLLDPAQEASNYSAPGADRFKLDPVLTVVDINDDIGPPDFVTLFTIKDGIIQTTFERSQYNILRSELAKRTFDESGDYYVTGMNIRIREHLDVANNGGLLTSAANGNTSLLSIGVEPGLAYVKGFEVGPLTTTFLEVDKSADYDYVNSQLSSATMGSYVTVKEAVGSPTLDQGLTIQLYDKAQARLSNTLFSTGAQTGNNIGSAILKTIEYNSGTLGTPTGKLDVYLLDIKMNGTNSFSSVKSLYYNDATLADFGADIVLSSSNTAVLQEASLTPLLYYVGSNSVRKIKDSSDTSNDTTFTFKKTASGLSIASAGTLTIPYSITNEVTPYGTSAALSATQKREITLSLDASVNVRVGGTASNTGKTLTGTGTAYDSVLNVGDKLEISGVAGTYFIESIASSSSLNLTSVPASTVSSATLFKAYKTGDIIDLTTKGNTGVTRAVSSTSTSLAIDLKESYGTTVAATVTSRVSRTAASQSNKLLRKSRYVIINCATAGISGPFTLGFSDIYKINNVVKKTGSAPASLVDGTDITSSFKVDSGQRDGYYDLGTITPNVTLGATDYLLVNLDYFYPDFTTGVGYFSVDSYPIDDTGVASNTIKTENIPVYKSPTSGQQYDLRNHVDFRPVKTITASDSTTVGGATTNPLVSTTFYYSGSGLRIPASGSTITYDYSYYLSRRDMVVVDQDGNFSTIRGVPSVIPITPRTPDNAMALAVLNITPYPSISPYAGQAIGRKDLSSWFTRIAPVRQTMRDIGVLKDRIVNLEYYTTLSLLEKSAIDFRVLDGNGLDRFKNGVFVDTFTSHILGATTNPDYKIVVDPKEKSIRPTYTMESFDYDYISGSGVARSNDIITLAYSEVAFANQARVTTTRNTERTTYRFIGNLVLSPDSDVWVDTQFAPDAALTFGPTDQEVTELDAGLVTEWDAWRTNITGYAVYRGSVDGESGGESKNPNYVGTYSSKEEAQSIANQYTNSTNVTIETIYNTARTGIDNFLIVNSDTQALGNKVVDVRIVPYIRPQTIKVSGRGLKPYARFYAYFDEQNLSSYVTPLTEAEFNTSRLTKTASSEGSNLKADAEGVVFFLLRLPPEKRFTTGSKRVILTDSPTNSAEDATTLGVGYFTAQGLIQQKQNTILTVRQVIPQQKEVSQGYYTSGFENVPQIVQGGGGGGKSCLAYSFVARAPDGEEGMFLTSIDVFVAQKHPTLGCWFEIREMDSGGKITRNQIPLSEVWIKNADIPISTNGTDNPLRVRFASPLFLYNKTQYAFIMHPEAVNPNYYFWVSRLGENDINTNTPVTARPMSGTMYTTNNNLNWDIVPDMDLTCIAYRAEFTTGTTGQAIIGNRGVEKLSVANVSNELTRYGEFLTTGDKLTLTANGTINVTDLLIGRTSNANSSVVGISGSVYTMSNTNYVSGETLQIRRANAYMTSISATVSSLTNGRGQLSKFKSSANLNLVTLTSSNGYFAQNDYIRNTTTGDYATIQTIQNFRYSVADFEPGYLTFNKTSIDFEMQTYSNTGTMGSYTKINPNENYYFSTEQALYSRSNEIASLSSDRSNKIRVSMSTATNFLSPVLDLSRTHTVYVDNIINNDATGEGGSSGGYLGNRYISKTVTLAEGQDAEDIKIVLTAYRPPNTDVRVWVKILNGEDSDSFIARSWIELEKGGNGDSVYSSLSNRDDFKEYEFDFASSYMTGSQGQVQYTNSQGIVFTGYKYFAIKVGLMASNSAVVPRVADLRTIALQI
ncbi:Domain of unknown function DUF4815 [uncultured Caudovirales phage]|uniref:DUF4815 domain-containing protein n=1 Tax=uncultured Caudovirales phage TaxID=2100421 RepID=A0A6J5SBJ6_9CAUD|nr:Domain of unknown function DUF4815 [uncultured Caudovirales phage]CAB4177152.1 Domain of unknown function DUF4815 [uncultured Caudovirales phage]CAB4181005.1 Domain of unknown function DUF4815 [uncultured Caudovirales phage]CAB4190865.1 Domain of unknown function DUF4815 [uncultured Caudovirales phage]CAB4211216.1 Domain of unknown function DUF4815 [uncultured Caudovirales phage]